MHAYTTIAAHCANRLNPLFPAEEWIAYSQQFLTPGSQSFNDWESAMAQAHRSLAGRTVPDAERLVKTEASRVLHKPEILAHFQEREASRIRLEEAQAAHDAIAQKEATERTFALQRKQLEARKFVADARWARDWDAEIRGLEAELESRISKPGELSAQDQSWINFWCAEIQQLEVMKRIAARRKAP